MKPILMYNFTSSAVFKHLKSINSIPKFELKYFSVATRPELNGIIAKIDESKNGDGVNQK